MTRLVNISKSRLQQVDPMAPLISITDRYSNGVAIPAKDQRPLLRAEFFPRDHAPELAADRCMTAELAEQIFTFAEAQRDAGAEVIYVQCGEGRIRSYTVCTALSQLEGMEHDHANSCIKSGVLDRYSYHLLGDALDKRLRDE